MDYTIVRIDDKSELIEKFIDYASGVKWAAGPFLARLIEKHGFFGYDSLFAILFKNKSFCGFCRFSSKDCVETPLEPWIGFLYIDEIHRGKRLSKLLIDQCIKEAKTHNFNKIYLASQEKGLYEKYGFSMIEYVFDVFGETEQLFVKDI